MVKYIIKDRYQPSMMDWRVARFISRHLYKDVATILDIGARTVMALETQEGIKNTRPVWFEYYCDKMNLDMDKFRDGSYIKEFEPQLKK